MKVPAVFTRKNKQEDKNVLLNMYFNELMTTNEFEAFRLIPLVLTTMNYFGLWLPVDFFDVFPCESDEAVVRWLQLSQRLYVFDKESQPLVCSLDMCDVASTT